MIKTVVVKEMNQIRNIVGVANRYEDEIGVHDAEGAIADAKSILGLMSLDYTRPVRLVSENAHGIEDILRALN
ncbi:MAG: HPr family phosphocarrier protein [Oscillospiraceae bacterium]|nr:HPr family phosphocarrier protein [Oscillospiraceae bacterium]